VAPMMRRDYVYKVLVGQLEGSRSLGTLRRSCVGTVTMNHRELEWDRMAWTDLAQDRDQ
jgi:hypothetical protein